MRPNHPLRKEPKVVDEFLKEILACPRCLAHPLHFGKEWIICPNPECGLQYPIRDGIPVMLIEEAFDPLTGRQVDPQSPRAKPIRPGTSPSAG